MSSTFQDQNRVMFQDQSGVTFVGKVKALPRTHPNWCWAVIVVLIVYILYVGGHLSGLTQSALDNRPRWMMGGLRDDTGSHNAKDVFGMGFGLDQTRVGTQTVDNKFKVQKGLASLALKDKVQGEYNGYLGQ